MSASSVFLYTLVALVIRAGVCPGPTTTRMWESPLASREGYRRTPNLRAEQLLLGHTKLESTIRYLGMEVHDALEISEQTEA